MKLDRIQDVMVPVKAVLGGTELSLEKMASLTVGSIIELDRLAGEPVDFVAAGEVVGRGEVVVIDEKFGIRLTEIRKREA
jgi:flagellar motor switch protein FliN/FliY